MTTPPQRRSPAGAVHRAGDASPCAQAATSLSGAAKRLLRHEDELFQFVLSAGRSTDNNLVERSIRPLVVIRKISGGSRSAEGTKTRTVLASLFEIWQARTESAGRMPQGLESAPTAEKCLTPNLNSYR